MEKFSLFDFLSFVLPGGTFIIFIYILILGTNIPLETTVLTETSFLFVPFLLVAYLLGHLLSLMGRKIEKIIPSGKNPWTYYLKKKPKQAVLINSMCVQFFNQQFIESEDNSISIEKSDLLYDKIFDYLEVNEKDKKIKILQSQYAFFRNSAAVWIAILFFPLTGILLKLLEIDLVINSISLLITYLICSIFLAVVSLYLMKQRKLLTMEYVYRTFLAINTNPLKS